MYTGDEEKTGPNRSMASIAPCFRRGVGVEAEVGRRTEVEQLAIVDGDQVASQHLILDADAAQASIDTATNELFAQVLEALDERGSLWGHGRIPSVVCRTAVLPRSTRRP